MMVPRGKPIGWVFASLLAMGQMNPQALSVKSNSASGQAITVHVEQVIAFNTPQNPLYKISYTYKFAEHKTVFIGGGPGLVHSEGEFTYLSRDLELDFFDSPGGPLIVAVPLEITFVPQGNATETLPKEADFTAEGQNGEWPGNVADFKSHFDKVFNSKGYDLGYAFCSADSQCIITRYKAIDFPAKHGEKARVAVKISYSNSEGAVHFRIHSKVQEKLSHGSWLDPGDPIVSEAAQGFVTRLLEQLGSRT